MKNIKEKNEVIKLCKKVINDYMLIYQYSPGTREEVEIVENSRKSFQEDCNKFLKSRPLSSYLLSDSNIKKRYDSIQEMDTTSYYHGYQHILNVIDNMNKLIDALDIHDDVEIDILLASVILHDIGRGATGKGHEERSECFAKEYFKSKDMQEILDAIFKSTVTDEYLAKDKYAVRMISESISNHEKWDLMDLKNCSILELLVNLADKLDITKKRVNLSNPLDPNLPSYEFDLYRKIYLDVEAVNIELKEKTLVIDIIGNENLTLNSLFTIPFMQKTKIILETLANKLELEPQIVVNGEKYYKDENIKTI